MSDRPSNPLRQYRDLRSSIRFLPIKRNWNNNHGKVSPEHMHDGAFRSRPIKYGIGEDIFIIRIQTKTFCSAQWVLQNLPLAFKQDLNLKNI